MTQLLSTDCHGMQDAIIAALQNAATLLDLSMPKSIQLTRCKDPSHGDFATNIAMVLAKQVGRAPRDIATDLVAALGNIDGVMKVDIAGPGFINFFVADDVLAGVVTKVLSAASDYGRVDVGQGCRVHLEYVSANPTGPLHVGHGRGAAYGSCLSALLKLAGFSVHSEYYVNDAGRQMDILAVSVWIRYLALYDVTIPFPVNAYQGDYIIDIAKTLQQQHCEKFVSVADEVLADLPLDEPQGGDKEVYIDAVIERAKQVLGQGYRVVHQHAIDAIAADIREDLAGFGVTFDEWFSERSLFDDGAVAHALNRLKDAGLTYEKNGAVWFKATEFEDDKDRVLVRDNGQTTYFASDAAYLLNKFDRGFEQAVCVFGADHHGYVPRLRALLTAYGFEQSSLQIPIVQFAVLYRGGEQVKMSTRSGSFVTLRELREDVGKDAARFFYVMRKVEQHLDFDLDLAKSQSNDNPVYYIQYAYARICSVFRQLAAKGWHYDEAVGVATVAQLKQPHETELMTQLAKFPEVIASCAERQEVHPITYYLRELAQAFHSYYNVQQFLIEDDGDMRHARLALLQAVKQVLHNGLQLLGLSSPEQM